MKTLVVVYSYHHNNTQKIAEVFAKVLDAQIVTPQQTDKQPHCIRSQSAASQTPSTKPKSTRRYERNSKPTAT
jgi:flavodoxin